MKAETFKKLLRMQLLKENTFDNECGKFRIAILLDEGGDLYFAKWKNDILVELVDLSKKARQYGYCNCQAWACD